jgi:selenocysteine lyase/cysteine desulfurase
VSLFRRQFLKLLGTGTLGLGVDYGKGILENSSSSEEKLKDGRREWLPEDVKKADESFWELVQQQFPLTDDRTHLNAAGLGPAPYPVLETARKVRMRLQRKSETGVKHLWASREPVAEFLGAREDEISFQRNATEGNSTVASGLELSQGDEVIFDSHAHPGGAMPWMNREKKDGIRVRVFEPDPRSSTTTLQRIEDLITTRTRVVQVSHVTAPTGIRLPVKRIAELAQEHDLWFHVDGAQSAGMLPVNLEEIGCDSYATSGHKWLGAPHGTGILYVRADRMDAVTPTEVGAHTDSAYEVPNTYNYHSSARRFEAGTRDAAAVMGVRAAVRFMSRIGIERVAERGQELARYLQERLRNLLGVSILTPNSKARSGAITAFKAEQVSYRDLYKALREQYSLRCRLVSEQGLDAVRVSTHIYNDIRDCDQVVEATRAITQDV